MMKSQIFLIFLQISISSSQSSPPRHQDVDHIEEIEVEETQVIITTTKDGPVEHLKIHIELVDIEANKKVNPVDLAGLWLTITRGRYTIPFLRPDTWYGVRFRSENIINGHSVVHEDERLIKTKARQQEGLGMAIGAFAGVGSPVLPTFTPIGFPPTIGVNYGQQNHVSGSFGSPPPSIHLPNDPHHPPNLLLPPVPPHNPLNPLNPTGPSPVNPHNPPNHFGPDPHHPPNPSTPHPPHHSPDAIDVKMHRSLDGVENFESLYVTVSWRRQNSEENRSNMTTGVVKLRVICDHSETNEEIKLKGDEDSVTIEITMDQKYDIEETDPLKHQIKAHITPLKCHKICWKSSLVLSSSAFGDFTKQLGDECKEISGTTSTTFLRNVKKVSVIENNLSENELIVETEVAEEEHGVVTLLLQKLGGGNETEEEEPIRKTFDTTTSNGRFIIPVEDDAIYAVSYTYVKIKPFHYTSKTHFLVESPAVNGTKPTHGLVDLSVIPTSFDYKHDKPDTVLKPEPPFLLLSRSPHYNHHDLLVKIEPFCNESSLKFRLEDRYPQHQIDAVPFLCGMEPKMYFCDKNVTYHKCDSTFCFSTSVLIGLDSYDTDTRCLNVTQHFPALRSVCVSTFSTLFLLQFLIIMYL